MGCGSVLGRLSFFWCLGPSCMTYAVSWCACSTLYAVLVSVSLALPSLLGVSPSRWVRGWGVSGISGLAIGVSPPRHGFVGSTCKDRPTPVAKPPSSPCGVMSVCVSCCLPPLARGVLVWWVRVWGVSGISGVATGPGPPRHRFVGST